LTDKAQSPIEAYINRLKGVETGHNIQLGTLRTLWFWQTSSFSTSLILSFLLFSFIYHILSCIPSKPWRV